MADLNPFKSNQTSAKKPVTRVPDSFVEALKDLGKSTATPTPDAFAWQRQQLEQERRLRLAEQQAFARHRRQEFLVFSQHEQQRQQEIKALQEQLQLLIEETQGLSQEIDLAVKQQIVNPGVYHLNFFERLRQIIKLMRQKIHDSQTWLSVFNGRSQQQGYWGQVSNSGTKFMLSQERYMVTQTG